MFTGKLDSLGFFVGTFQGNRKLWQLPNLIACTLPFDTTFNNASQHGFESLSVTFAADF